ncbi:hypothetical protein C8J57DRAFT_1534216 [Mycena rebaudengoi]|nr:hypothetical protein C8J57DRAFT_1534216 [Mycena rebaudengoi]
MPWMGGKGAFLSRLANDIAKLRVYPLLFTPRTSQGVSSVGRASSRYGTMRLLLLEAPLLHEIEQLWLTRDKTMGVEARGKVQLRDSPWFPSHRGPSMITPAGCAAPPGYQRGDLDGCTRACSLRVSLPLDDNVPQRTLVMTTCTAS